jgi:hypothetical protein
MVAGVTPCFFRSFRISLSAALRYSPWLNEDVQDLAFAVHGPPDVQLSAVDGDEHFVEMPPPVRPRPSSSQLARNDPAELQSPAADRLVGHIDASLGEHILDVAVAGRGSNRLGEATKVSVT